eukprot:scaffold5297_cov374-Prasinococcus_capsulatus_cf.AAC.13
MGRQKIALIYMFTSLGFDLLLSDVDVVYMRNPHTYMVQPEFQEADILCSSDHLRSSIPPGDEGLEVWQKAGSAMNIGIMLFRATKASKDFAVKWQEVIDKDANVWDQNAFNDLARKRGVMDVPGTRLFYGWEGRVKIGILSVALFGSGHTFFVQKLYERQGVQPYAVHATFQYGGTEGKRHRLREAMLWRDPIEYYDPPGYASPSDAPPGGPQSRGKCCRA